MTKCYTKQPLNLDDQLELLASRGLDIGNRNDAREKLSAINYYRLSGYWHSFRARNSDGMVTDAFRTGNNLTNIITLYEFDRHLRLMVMDALERVEIAVRTQITPPPLLPIPPGASLWGCLNNGKIIRCGMWRRTLGDFVPQTPCGGCKKQSQNPGGNPPAPFFLSIFFQSTNTCECDKVELSFDQIGCVNLTSIKIG
ncbi:MAG: Abi family protein [Magnetococcales bacterium]|nr:Abi family protein [Magnetococcales bacterium]